MLFVLIGVEWIGLTACRSNETQLAIKTPAPAIESSEPPNFETVNPPQDSTESSPLTIPPASEELITRNFDRFALVSEKSDILDYLMPFSDSGYIYMAIDPITQNNQLRVHHSHGAQNSKIIWEGNAQIDSTLLPISKEEEGGWWRNPVRRCSRRDKVADMRLPETPIRQ